MKAYGHSRSDIGISCPYGCCTGQSDKRRNFRDQRDRTRRKSERRNAKHESRFQAVEVKENEHVE